MDIRFSLGLNAAENIGYMKKASSKSCSKLNFLQKRQWAHMSTTTRSGTRGIERLLCLKYFSFFIHK